MKKGFRISALAALVMLLASCASMPMAGDAGRAPVAASERQPDAVKPELEAEEGDKGAVEAGSTPAAKPSNVLQEGTGQLINIDAASKLPRKPPEQGKASLNFADMPIADVVKMILGDLLGENYIISAGVSGTVTFSTARPVTPEQAFSILEMLLSWNNLALVYVDGQYSVVPSANAVRGNLTPRVGSAEQARGYEVRAVPLDYIAPTEMEKLLQPYAKEGAILKADNARSIIVVAGSRRELENYMATIDVFDVDWIKGMSIGLITLEQAEAKTLGPELEQIFGEQSQSPLAGMFRFIPIERLNAIMVITPQRRYLDEAERWIARLDQGGNQPGVRLYVYDVKNVKATDLADRLNDIFGSSGGESSRANTSSAAGGLAPGLQPVELSSSTGGSLNLRGPTGEKASEPKSSRSSGSSGNSGDSRPAAASGGGAVAVGGGGAGGDQGLAIVEGDDIRITAVEENNQLIIRATPAQYDAIRGAIRKLDSVPLQVHIEARLLDVSLINNLRFGVQWYFEQALPLLVPPDDGTGTGGGSSAAKAVVERMEYGVVNGTSNDFIFRGTSAGALVQMLQSEGDVKVLSAPSVMVLNNTEASINVGQQIPVVSSQFVGIGTGGSGSVGQSYVQFRDTGIILNVKPRVNPGGLVFMEIQAEQSTPGAASDAIGGNVPVDKKTIETEVAVQSGDTVLLGGLIQQNDSNSQSGFPGLMKIPVIGRLFGSSSRDNSRKELLVLITPTVIRGGGESARELTEEYKKRFQGLSPLIEDMEAAERARKELKESER
ncbi:MAG: type II secretion system secretin GspD [Lysobacterales bacterium]|nr:type II secretion system secretin GspD [Xanthomonadales bacterium]